MLRILLFCSNKNLNAFHYNKHFFFLFTVSNFLIMQFSSFSFVSLTFSFWFIFLLVSLFCIFHLPSKSLCLRLLASSSALTFFVTKIKTLPSVVNRTSRAISHGNFLFWSSNISTTCVTSWLAWRKKKRAVFRRSKKSSVAEYLTYIQGVPKTEQWLWVIATSKESIQFNLIQFNITFIYKSFQ